MNTDPLADMLTRIRNATKVGHPAVTIPNSSLKRNILSLLKTEGYIDGFEVQSDETKKSVLKVMLKYGSQGKPAIAELSRVSRPGRRRYVSSSEIPYCRGGLGTYIVSTPEGLMPDRVARKKGIGGELLCSVF